MRQHRQIPGFQAPTSLPGCLPTPQPTRQADAQPPLKVLLSLGNLLGGEALPAHHHHLLLIACTHGMQAGER